MLVLLSLLEEMLGERFFCPSQHPDWDAGLDTLGSRRGTYHCYGSYLLPRSRECRISSAMRTSIADNSLDELTNEFH